MFTQESDKRVEPEASPLLPYQQRVVEEQNELRTKIVLLVDFLHTGKVLELSYSEIKRLERQLQIMQTYSAVLLERIHYFNNQETPGQAVMAGIGTAVDSQMAAKAQAQADSLLRRY